jgi:hypothetical protein
MPEKQTRKALSKQPQSHPLDDEPAAREEQDVSGHDQLAAPPGEGESVRRSAGDDVPVQLSFRVPSSIRHRLKVHAAKVDRAQQDVIAEALDGYLSRQGD